jgi:opacity protein-like surface antigen
MKPILLIPLVLALPAFAGTPAPVTAPPSNPCLTNWFAGASVGYLTELEAPMYTAHLGVTNSCWMLGGWNVGLFLEVGYTQTDEDYSPRDRETPPIKMPRNISVDVDEMGDALQYAADYFNAHTSYDLDIVPISLNVKFERALSGNLNVYLGGGLGVAYVGLDLAGHTSEDSLSASDTDWVFYGQIFAGLSYNLSPNFQIYGGARWIYMSDADFSDRGESATLELGSDCLLELGVCFKF